MRTIWIIPGMFGLNVSVTFGNRASGTKKAPKSFTRKIFVKVWTRITEMQERHYQRRQLKALPAYMLKDLGLSQKEVQVECQKPFWR